MISAISRSKRLAAALLCAMPFVAGCASLVSNAASGFAEDLSMAVLNQDDPETAKAALPSYMVLIDSLVEGSPDDADMLAAAAEMYASYGAVFADNEVRARRLTSKGRRYAQKALCEQYAEEAAGVKDRLDEASRKADNFAQREETFGWFATKPTVSPLIRAYPSQPHGRNINCLK